MSLHRPVLQKLIQLKGPGQAPGCPKMNGVTRVPGGMSSAWFSGNSTVGFFALNRNSLNLGTSSSQDGLPHAVGLIQNPPRLPVKRLS